MAGTGLATVREARPSAIVVCHCPVCTVPLPGVRCALAAGLAGFFRCNQCGSELQMRGRFAVAVIALLLLGALLILDTFFYTPHRPIGVVIDVIVQILSVLFVGYLSVRILIHVERRFPDATFVL